MDCHCHNAAAAAPPPPPPLVEALLAQHPVAVAAGAFGAILILVGLALRFRWLARVPFLVLLYTRLNRSRVVGSDARGRILAEVTQNPGVSTTALQSALRLNAGTLEYHLRVLEEAELVKTLRIGRSRSWYATGTAAPDAQTQSALAAPARQALVHLVEARPGLTLAKLASEMGLAKATVHEHLGILVGARLVRVERSRLLPTYHPARAIEAPMPALTR